MDTPRQPVLGFLSELAGEDLPEGWSGGWEGQRVFLQIYQEDLERRAKRICCCAKGLSQGDADSLCCRGFRGLPWERARHHALF